MDFGTLHLGTQSVAAQSVLSWTDLPEHKWMLAAVALLLLFLLPELMNLLPTVIGALHRRRGNLEIEHSLSVARSRNFCSRLLCVPVILICDRYNLYPASFVAPWTEPWLRAGEMAGVFLAFLLLRICFHHLFFSFWPPRLDNESRTTVLKGCYNYFVVLSVLMLVSCCFFVILDVDEKSISLILWAEIAVFWLLSLSRESQILATKCSGLGTFLYLCGLEFLPAGLLITSAFLL